MADVQVMDDQQATEVMIAVVSGSRALDPSVLTAATSFVGDPGFDSLDAAELLAALHRQTGRHLPAADVSGLQTIGQDAKALIAEECPS
jgi:acyl carrier protein